MNKFNYFMVDKEIMEVNSNGRGYDRVREFEDEDFSLSVAMKITAALNRADNRGWVEHKAVILNIINKRRDEVCQTLKERQ